MKEQYRRLRICPNYLTTYKEKLKEIEKELADIAIYVLDFCNITNIDLSSAILNKLEENIRKYPVEKVKGKAYKYTYYEKEQK